LLAILEPGRHIFPKPRTSRSLPTSWPSWRPPRRRT